MALPPGRSPRAGRGRARRALNSGINVTPFVDVVLVLLIIFMVTAPLLTTGVEVELPKTDSAALESNTQPVTITVRADGRVFIQSLEVSAADFAEKLKAVAEAGERQKIFVRADGRAAYSQVAGVMAAANGAGFRKLALVTDPLDAQPATKR